LHPGFELEGSNLSKIVEALRSYMRDKVDSQAVRSGRPQLFAYQNLAQSLEALTFEQRK
jgi:lipid-binding SYLF domain-containing protein